MATMRYLVLAVLPACGFAPTPATGGNGNPPGLDAEIDAVRPVVVDARPIDAPPDAPKTWQVLETLTVPCSGTSVTSTTVLTSTGQYHLRASTECIANTINSSASDAEYFGYNVNQFSDSASGVDNGISIDSTTPGDTRTPRWGNYTNTHVYEVPWTGGNATITANYWDSNYGNNSGSLKLEILSYQ